MEFLVVLLAQRSWSAGTSASGEKTEMLKLPVESEELTPKRPCVAAVCLTWFRSCRARRENFAFDPSA